LPREYHPTTLLQFVTVMDLLWVFLVVAPLALALLIAFAAHIDPLSGRWRTPGFKRRGKRSLLAANDHRSILDVGAENPAH
jgi:hypothetical protein